MSNIFSLIAYCLGYAALIWLNSIPRLCLSVITSFIQPDTFRINQYLKQKIVNVEGWIDGYQPGPDIPKSGLKRVANITAIAVGDKI